MTSSLMTVALLSDRSAAVILRPKSASTILLTGFELVLLELQHHVIQFQILLLLPYEVRRTLSFVKYLSDICNSNVHHKMQFARNM